MRDRSHVDGTAKTDQTAVIRMLHEGPGFRLGHFVCPPGDQRWTGVNWIGPAVIVAFPMRSVLIRQPGYEVLTDPNIAVFYEADMTFTRELADPRGDRCTFVEIDASLMDEISPSEEIRGPLSVDARIYIAQWATLRSLLSGDPVERITVDELFFGILGRLFAAHELGSRAAITQKELVADTRSLLADDFTQPWTLQGIARAVHASPYHLSRTFRQVTGTTLSTYVTQLRLRASLERIVDGSPLDEVACELGFTSHSHFTARFRESFGVTPSTLRSRAMRVDDFVEAIRDA